MSGGATRRTYIDWARGLAVLLMIEAHTLDAWTRAASRHGAGFRRGVILGGFAAPAFLWLAGVSLVLGAVRLTAGADRRTAVESVCKRGLEIFILAFLFRIQAFVVSPGSYPVTIFRVDILNVMGLAIVAAGLLWGAVGGRRPTAPIVVYAAAATAIAMLAPVVRSLPAVDLLPTWLQWYLRPSGDYTTFTLFPWAGFVCAGAATGALIAAAGDSRQEWRVHTALIAAGAALIALGLLTARLPTIYRTASFWTNSPTWFAIRVGVLNLAMGVLFAAGRLFNAMGHEVRWLARFGRSSLFVYWIHVELVYGYASWPLRGHLPLWGTALAGALFTAALYKALAGRDRLVTAWHARAGRREPAQLLRT